MPAAVLPGFTYGVNSANGIITGNTTLKPEVANTYSAGVVLRPHFGAAMASDLGVSVDYYHIKIEGAIAGVTLDAILQSCFNANGSNPSYWHTRVQGDGGFSLPPEASLIPRR